MIWFALKLNVSLNCFNTGPFGIYYSLRFSWFLTGLFAFFMVYGGFALFVGFDS